MIQDPDHERIALLAVLSTPVMRHVGENVVQKNWIIRTTESYHQNLKVWAGELESAVARFVQEAYSGDYPPEELADCLIRVELVRVDDRHLVVRAGMSARNPGGPGRLAAEYELLRQIDSVMRVEALQGFPRQFWPLVFQE